jgi:predicted PurR-regulated permease PerM
MDDIAKTAQEVLSGMLGKGSSAVKSLASVAAWAVMPVYLAFMLTLRVSPPVSIETFLPFLKEQTRNDVAYLAREFMKILVSFFRGQFVVAVLQGLVYGTLYAVMGLKMGFVIGFLQGLFNVVPFLGTLGGIAIAVPTALLQDGGGSAMLVKWAIAFGIGQLVETYLITPRIQGESTGLHPMAIIFAVFFWGTAFQGMMGLFLAIPLTAFVVVVWRLVKTKYITEIV